MTAAFSAAVAFLWDRVPGYVKWPVVLVMLLFWAPIRIRDEVFRVIDSRVHAVVAPMNDKRDDEIKGMKKDIKDSKRGIEVIGYHLMGINKYKRMTANDGGDE
jgi:hypothetical protein